MGKSNERWRGMAARSFGCLLFCAYLLSAAGCASVPWPFHSSTAAKETADAKSSAAKSSAAPPKSSGGAADSDALKQVMSELQEAGALDPAGREQLIADLKQTDPSRWPLVVQEFRAAAAYRRRTESERSQSTHFVQRDDDKTANASDRKDYLAGRDEYATAPRSRALDPLVDNRLALSPEPAVAGVADTGGAREIASAQKAGEAMAIPIEPPPLSARLTASRDESPPLPRGEATALAALTLDPIAKGNGLSTPLTQADWQTHLAAAIRSMETASAKGSASESDVAVQARLRMLYLLAGRRDDAMRPLPAAPKSTQEYWTSQVYGLATWMDADKTPDPARRAAEAKRILTEAVNQLGNTALLTVRNLTFCSSVQYYGSFEAVKSPEFTTGQKVLLYAEVENFRTEPSPKGFHTAVKFNWQIFDARGNRVGENVAATSEETSLTPKHEFFITKWFFLPASMPSGKYTLQFTVEDVLGKKVGQSSIEMTIKP